MTKEEYVSYEQAVKLKELGFDYKCYDFFTEDVKLPLSEIKPFPKPKNWNESEDKISAPRLDQVQKWLREIKGIDIEPRVWLVGGNVNIVLMSCLLNVMTI